MCVLRATGCAGRPSGLPTGTMPAGDSRGVGLMATLGLHVVGGDRSAALGIAPGGADWTTRAVCATQDPDLLFVTGAAQREAAKMCRGCPVKLDCLADALDNQVEFGVWGGLTDRQRRALLKR